MLPLWERVFTSKWAHDSHNAARPRARGYCRETKVSAKRRGVKISTWNCTTALTEPRWRISTVCIHLGRTTQPALHYSVWMTFETAKVVEIVRVFEGAEKIRHKCLWEKVLVEIKSRTELISSWAWELCYLFSKWVRKTLWNGSIWKVMGFAKWPKKVSFCLKEESALG